VGSLNSEFVLVSSTAPWRPRFSILFHRNAATDTKEGVSSDALEARASFRTRSLGYVRNVPMKNEHHDIHRGFIQSHAR
jgi:hypothetical protein